MHCKEREKLTNDFLRQNGTIRKREVAAGLVPHASPLDALLRGRIIQAFLKVINRDRFLKDVIDGNTRSTSTHC